MTRDGILGAIVDVANQRGLCSEIVGRGGDFLNRNGCFRTVGEGEKNKVREEIDDDGDWRLCPMCYCLVLRRGELMAENGEKEEGGKRRRYGVRRMRVRP